MQYTPNPSRFGARVPVVHCAVDPANTMRSSAGVLKAHTVLCNHPLAPSARLMHCTALQLGRGPLQNHLCHGCNCCWHRQHTTIVLGLVQEGVLHREANALGSGARPSRRAEVVNDRSSVLGTFSMLAGLPPSHLVCLLSTDCSCHGCSCAAGTAHAAHTSRVRVAGKCVAQATRHAGQSCTAQQVC
jgi:hypothetical protein